MHVHVCAGDGHIFSISSGGNVTNSLKQLGGVESASLGLADCSQVGIPGSRCKFVTGTELGAFMRTTHLPLLRLPFEGGVEG